MDFHEYHKHAADGTTGAANLLSYSMKHWICPIEEALLLQKLCLLWRPSWISISWIIIRLIAIPYINNTCQELTCCLTQSSNFVCLMSNIVNENKFISASQTLWTHFFDLSKVIHSINISGHSYFYYQRLSFIFKALLYIVIEINFW